MLEYSRKILVYCAEIQKNQYGQIVKCLQTGVVENVIKRKWFCQKVFMTWLPLSYCNIWTFRKSLCKTAWVEIAQKTSKQVLDTSKRISIESLYSTQLQTLRTFWQIVKLHDLWTAEKYGYCLEKRSWETNLQATTIQSHKIFKNWFYDGVSKVNLHAVIEKVLTVKA